MKFLNTTVKTRDHSGALAVHASGGLIGIIGMTFLGRRLLKLKSIDESSLGSESPNTIVLGYLLLANGLIGLSLPYNSVDVRQKNHFTSVILLNSVVGLSGGILASVVLEFILWKEVFNYWVLLRLLQGGIAGLVLLSSFINYCNPPALFAVTFIAGILVNCMSKLVYKTALEDYCNIIPIHFFCGIWSPILQPFFANTNSINPIEFLWQITSVAIIISFILALFVALFLIVWCSGFLRNQEEENCHTRSLKVIERSEECPLSRLFVLKAVDDILEPGVSGKSPHNLAGDRQTDTIHRLVEEENVEANQIEEKIKSEHEIRKFEVSGNKITPNNLIKPLPKSKNIYTVHKILTSDKNIFLKDQPLCSGDASNDRNVYRLDDLIANKSENVISEDTKKGLVNIKLKVLKHKSHIRLSKSNRYIDFSKRKRLKKTRKNKTNALVNVYINRSSELIAYDKKYNDGIITYKVPRFIEYISD